MLRSVAVVLLDGIPEFEFGVACEVFGTDRSEQGLPVYDFAVVAGEPPPLRLRSGLTVVPPHGLDRLVAADLVIMPGRCTTGAEPPAPLLDALRAVIQGGARVMSFCAGAFVLAAAGLLDDRRTAVHWLHADELAARYPRVRVDRDVLYVDDGQVLTSAGTAAAIDLALHVVRTEHGPAVANAVARRMVMPPQRDGGQAQYVESPVPRRCADDGIGRALTWALRRLDEPLPVERLAAKALMSPRTFARRFRDATGTTPHEWLVTQRVLHAERLLEDGRSVEEVARHSGFGTAAALREQFVRRRGVPPQVYRRSFAAR